MGKSFQNSSHRVHRDLILVSDSILSSLFLFLLLSLANCNIFDTRHPQGVCVVCYGHSRSSFISSSAVAVGEFAGQGCMWQTELNASNYPTESLSACYLSANNETKTSVRL